MSQTGYTPIQLYRSTTPAAAPVTGNLSPGELAINISDTDMAIYAENASGDVKRIINNPSGLKYPTADGTNGQAVATDGSGNLSFITVVTASGTATLTNKTITGLKETKVVISAADIDLTAGNYFTKTLSTNTTFTVSNVPTTGTVAAFVLDLTNSGTYITWWSNLKWAGGTAPTLTTSGRDVLGFFTHDGGTTWNGFVLGKDVK